MGTTSKNIKPPPPPLSALGGWWKGLFGKKEVAEEVPCWSCSAIRNTGSLAPWDIDCRNCESPVLERLGEKGRIIDLEKVLESFPRERDYRWIFSILNFILKKKKAVKYVLKIDFRKREVDSFVMIGEKKVEMIPIGFFWWRDFVKTLEGIFWVGKRPFIHLEKSGIIYRAKLFHWFKGVGETLVIDVMPEK